MIRTSTQASQCNATPAWRLGPQGRWHLRHHLSSHCVSCLVVILILILVVVHDRVEEKFEEAVRLLHLGHHSSFSTSSGHKRRTRYKKTCDIRLNANEEKKSQENSNTFFRTQGIRPRQSLVSKTKRLKTEQNRTHYRAIFMRYRKHSSPYLKGILRTQSIQEPTPSNNASLPQIHREMLQWILKIIITHAIAPCVVQEHHFTCDHLSVHEFFFISPLNHRLFQNHPEEYSVGTNALFCSQAAEIATNKITTLLPAVQVSGSEPRRLPMTSRAAHTRAYDRKLCCWTLRRCSDARAYWFITVAYHRGTEQARGVATVTASIQPQALSIPHLLPPLPPRLGRLRIIRSHRLRPDFH